MKYFVISQPPQLRGGLRCAAPATPLPSASLDRVVAHGGGGAVADWRPLCGGVYLYTHSVLFTKYVGVYVSFRSHVFVCASAHLRVPFLLSLAVAR